MRWTDKEIKTLSELYANGVSSKKISEILNRTQSSVKMKASKLGIAKKRKNPSIKPKLHKDLSGLKFGKLNAIKPLYKNKHNAVMWECSCDCGNPNHTIVSEYNLMNGHSKSCGCSWKETCHNNFKKYNYFEFTEQYGICHMKDADCIFDIEDYDLVKDYCWRVTSNGYVQSINPNTKRAIMFHRLVMKAYETSDYEKMDIDHIDLNPLNNQKKNLRFATRSQNNVNRPPQKNNTSGVTGVQKIVLKNGQIKWTAEVYQKHKRILLGTFNTFEEAVNARTNGENKYYKEFSYNNTQKLLNKEVADDKKK